MAIRKNFKLLKYKHIIHNFEARDLEISICNYFREICKLCDFMNTLRNFAKSVFAHIFTKFKYFTKQFISTESPDQVKKLSVGGRAASAFYSAKLCIIFNCCLFGV